MIFETWVSISIFVNESRNESESNLNLKSLINMVWVDYNLNLTAQRI